MGVMADDAIRFQDLGWQDSAVFGWIHTRMCASRDDEKHVFIANAGVAHALQHRRQQMLMGNGPRLVVDGDGDRLPGSRR